MKVYVVPLQTICWSIFHGDDSGWLAGGRYYDGAIPYDPDTWTSLSRVEFRNNTDDPLSLDDPLNLSLIVYDYQISSCHVPPWEHEYIDISERVISSEAQKRIRNGMMSIIHMHFEKYYQLVPKHENGTWIQWFRWEHKVLEPVLVRPMDPPVGTDHLWTTLEQDQILLKMLGTWFMCGVRDTPRGYPRISNGTTKYASLISRNSSIEPMDWLLSYQHRMVDWMVETETGNHIYEKRVMPIGPPLFRNRVPLGIVAVDPGLGKTRIVSSFLSHMIKTGKGYSGPTLIIVPTSIVDQWRETLEFVSQSSGVEMQVNIFSDTGQFADMLETMKMWDEDHGWRRKPPAKRQRISYGPQTVCIIGMSLAKGPTMKHVVSRLMYNSTDKDCLRFARVIVDEYHEYISQDRNMSRMNFLHHLPSDFTWMISATPALSTVLTYCTYEAHLVPWLPLVFPYGENCNRMVEVWEKDVQDELKSKDMVIPEVLTVRHYLKMNKQERAIYDFFNKTTASILEKETSLDERIQLMSQFPLLEIMSGRAKAKSMEKILRAVCGSFMNIQMSNEARAELADRIRQSGMMSHAAHSEVNGHLRSIMSLIYEYRSKSNASSSAAFAMGEIASLETGSSSTVAECPVCLSDVDLEKHMTRAHPCMHALCDDCAKHLGCTAPVKNENNKLVGLAAPGTGWSKVSCPQCRGQVSSFVYGHYIADRVRATEAPVAVDQVENESLSSSPYGTKIDTLVDLMCEINAAGEKALIYIETVSLGKVVSSILETHPRKEQFGKVVHLQGRCKSRIASEFKKSSEDVHLIITELSGLDFVNVQHIIVFQPFTDDEARTSGKQLRNRCHRLGQTKQTSFHELRFANTIEDDRLDGSPPE